MGIGRSQYSRVRHRPKTVPAGNRPSTFSGFDQCSSQGLRPCREPVFTNTTIGQSWPAGSNTKACVEQPFGAFSKHRPAETLQLTESLPAGQTLSFKTGKNHVSRGGVHQSPFGRVQKRDQLTSWASPSIPPGEPNGTDHGWSGFLRFTREWLGPKAKNQVLRSQIRTRTCFNIGITRMSLTPTDHSKKPIQVRKNLSEKKNENSLCNV